MYNHSTNETESNQHSLSSNVSDPIPSVVKEAVLMDSLPMPKKSEQVRGMDFEDKLWSLKTLLDSYKTSGFQATHLGLAIEQVNKMIHCRETYVTHDEKENKTQNDTKSPLGCTIWLSFTSNMMSSGLREIFTYLAKNKLVDVIVTSAGGIEEDFVKCLAPTYIGEFSYKGEWLRNNGWNRIGNLIVPNENYCLFEDWLQPILDQMLLEQQTSTSKNFSDVEVTSAFKGEGNNSNENMSQGIPTNHDNEDISKCRYFWTPSELINRLGKEINDETSLYYWCHKNRIPVFCPGITDGSLGDNLFFHAYRNPGLVIDVVQDIKRINTIALNCRKSGMIILGGGIAKHHTCNANLMRNGADFAVYINTSSDQDGSDSGAKPDEAVSWGKIKASAEPVKVVGDATIIFPLIVAATFASK